MEEPPDPAERARRLRRARSVAGALGLAALWIGTTDISLRSVTDALALLVIAGLGFLIESCTERPARSYYRAALVSAALFWVLVFGVLSWGGNIALGSICWIGMSALALLWAVGYERIEPRA